MNEQIKNEISNGAKAIGLTEEEALNKFEEICQENNIETTNPLAKGLWRSYVASVKRTQNTDSSGNSNESYYKKAFGFFVSLDAPIDVMAWNRGRAIEEFKRDSDNALENGFVAVATKNALGKWVVSRYHNNEYEEKTVSSLPNGAEETEDGTVFIPLDNTPTYMNGGKNANYGKPLPVEQFQRRGVFFGDLGDGEMKTYTFSYKNQAGVEFAPNTFEWLHFLCIVSNDNSSIYGVKEMTLDSLSLNSELSPENDLYRDMSSFDFEDCLRNNFGSHLVPLVDLDKAHIERQSLSSRERFVITDGTVCNMNMNPTANGNRIINLTDINAEFDFENEGVVTCWIPSHINIDFGVMSSVIIVGRTSQRTTDEGVEPVTINVSGLICTVKHGSAVEISQPIEENFDWF